MDFEERFRSKLVTTDQGCWEFQGSRNLKGYGRIFWDGKLISTHRAAYMLWVGEIPDGLVIDHIGCDNPPCCNPAHLRACTWRENTLRGNAPAAIQSRMTSCKNGHELSGKNLMLTHGGKKRRCRICHNEIGKLNKRKARSKVSI